jgi:nicotinate phosphoribosyltransferase
LFRQMDSSAHAGRFPFLPQVLSGETADVYFRRTYEVLEHLGTDPLVGMEIFPGKPGYCCGVTQVAELLQEAGFNGELWALDEGAAVERGEAAVEIFGRYRGFGLYETALIGILASCTAWCTAAREVVDAAGTIPVISFGARHVHPNVAGIMDWAAVVGGCVTCSTPLGAALAGTAAAGTMPHALMLVVGDTVEVARAFDQAVQPEVPRIVLVDTFQDEAVESLQVAAVLGDALQGVRLDTPRERGGVTPALVNEVRARLDLAGFTHVQITVSGGVTPDRIAAFREAGAAVDSFGVGSYISGAVPIDYTADIREIEGKPVAKRGRLPGMQRSERLHRLL